MPGLDDHELAAQSASALPAREQMSLLTTGGLGSGVLDTGSTAPDTGGGLDSTDASGSTDPDAHASAGEDLGPAATYVEDAEQTQDDLSQTPTQNDGAYDPDQTASSTTD